LEACLTIDGASCHGDIRRVALDTSLSWKTLGGSGRIDTWGRPVWAHDVSQNRSFGVLLRNADPAPTVSVDAVEMDVLTSEQPAMPPAGNFQVCAPAKSNGGWRCSFPGAGGAGANVAYWIQPETGEVRNLGRIEADRWGGPRYPCFAGNGLWDPENPDVYYCGAFLDGQGVLLKGTLTGNDQPVGPDGLLRADWENLTPATVGPLIKAFASDFDPNRFSCYVYAIVTNHAVFACLYSEQASLGWIAVLDLGNRKPIGSGGTGKFIAAASTYSSPNARWCGLHSLEPLGDIDWIGWTPHIPWYGREGFGPYTVTLRSELRSGPGMSTIQVSGEPSPRIQDALAGDVFYVGPNQSYDLLRIVEKISATEWRV
ncbi:MAG: hypothetical protein ACRD96_18020, partial [Bryobacteraceae bacterium]